MSDETAGEKQGAHALGFELPAPARLTPSGAIAVALAAVVAISGVAFLVTSEHKSPGAAPASGVVPQGEKAAETGRRVEVVRPVELKTDRAIVLPGTVQPREETALYARASGYVRKWHVDIGDEVKEGALLAEIDTPELDQELAQSRAQLAQAEASVVQTKANRDLAKTNLARSKLLAPAIVSAAELDQSAAQAEVSEANVRVAEANASAQESNIRRLSQLKEFSHVTAPFAGTITQRTIERGTLVTAANPQPLFRLAATDPVRLFVQVPQGVAPGVKAGAAARVRVREYPSRAFEGTITRSARELDSATRTMTTEVQTPNHDGALIAGMYAEVSLDLPVTHRVLQLPATALLSDAKGERIALVNDKGQIHLQSVVIERDNGGTIDISSGLSGDDRVVTIANPSLMEGEAVTVALPPLPKQK